MLAEAKHQRCAGRTKRGDRFGAGLERHEHEKGREPHGLEQVG